MRWSACLTLLVLARVLDAQAPAERRFTLVAAGSYHTCALAADSTAWCWGAGAAAQLGPVPGEECRSEGETAPCALLPRRVPGEDRFVSLDGGEYHTCALTATGAAMCWGNNTVGQLGTESGDQRCGKHLCSVTPLRVQTQDSLVALTVGGNHSCALTAAGTTLCWGWAWRGLTGSLLPTETCDPNPRGICHRRPVALTGAPRWSAIEAAQSQTCATTADSALWCWGEAKSPTPAPVGVTSVASFATGDEDRTCILGREGVPRCSGQWQLNCCLRMGFRFDDNTSVYPDTARERGIPVRFVSLAAGALHVCGLTEAGVAYCWGSDEETSGARGRRPERARTEARFSSLAAGGYHTCGLTAEGQVLCWGDNSFGQLGNGSTRRQGRPTPMAAPR